MPRAYNIIILDCNCLIVFGAEIDAFALPIAACSGRFQVRHPYSERRTLPEAYVEGAADAFRDYLLLEFCPIWVALNRA